MASKDLHHSIKAVVALAPQSITSDTTTAGVIVDTLGFEGVEFVIATGAIADANLVPLIEEDTVVGFGTATAVADADLIGTEAGATLDQDNDSDTAKIGYIGSKRFVRLSLVSTSTTGANLVGAVALLGHARHSGVADSQTEPA